MYFLGNVCCTDHLEQIREAVSKTNDAALSYGAAKCGNSSEMSKLALFALRENLVKEGASNLGSVEIYVHSQIYIFAVRRIAKF